MTLFRFQCGRCDEWHEGAPSIAFQLPDHLLTIFVADRATRAKWDEDLCVIDNQYYFVRACLEVPIINSEEPFLWGIWGSLSERSFNGYIEDGEGPYFSWPANHVPGYPPLDGLKASLHPRSGNLRPILELEVSDHPLSVDFHQGISVERARTFFEAALHGNQPPH